MCRGVPFAFDIQRFELCPAYVRGWINPKGGTPRILPSAVNPLSLLTMSSFFRISRILSALSRLTSSFFLASTSALRIFFLSRASFLEVSSRRTVEEIWRG